MRFKANLCPVWLDLTKKTMAKPPENEHSTHQRQPNWKMKSIAFWKRSFNHG
jgi:hypothetical protein